MKYSKVVKSDRRKKSLCQFGKKMCETTDFEKLIFKRSFCVNTASKLVYDSLVFSSVNLTDLIVPEIIVLQIR